MKVQALQDLKTIYLHQYVMKMYFKNELSLTEFNCGKGQNLFK